MRSTSKKYDVVALGEAMLEFNQVRADQPDYLQGFGGDTSNAVIAAARAGVKTAYLTRVGVDAFGQALLGLWANEGVDTRAVHRDADAPTGIYFVTHGKTGHQFSYLRAGSAASLMTPQWLTAKSVESQDSPADIISSAQFLHLSGISLAISSSACDTAFAAMAHARAAGTQVSFDSNLRLKLWPRARAQACIMHAVSMCDVFLPSQDDMVMLCGLSDPQSIIDWGHAHGAKTVVLKLGAEGALASDGTQRRAIDSCPVSAVDATGAGDCFCGNLLARLAIGDDLFTACAYANAAAGLAVQGFGAVAPLPTRAQVNQVLVET